MEAGVDETQNLQKLEVSSSLMQWQFLVPWVDFPVIQFPNLVQLR